VLPVGGKKATGCQWLTPVILTSQEAEISRIVVRSQPQANSSQDPISKKPFKKRVIGVAQGEGLEFKLQYHKKKKKKKPRNCGYWVLPTVELLMAFLYLCDKYKKSHKVSFLK
jgi:uncharacterized protein (UPF0128 family)